MALENLDQKRAHFAWERAKSCRNDEYKNSVKKLLPIIQANGLIAALAHYQAKDDKQVRKVYKHIEEWLKKQNYIQNDNTNMIQQLLNKQSMDILEVTREVVAIGGWLKRMVDAVQP